MACILVPARRAEAQWGISLRGFVYGVPGGGATVPGDTSFAATIFVPAERGTQFLPIRVVFPANGVQTRTAIASAGRTQILNGQLLDVHVLPEPGGWTVRVLRDVATIRVSGGVLELMGGAFNNPPSECVDPRDCSVASGQTGRIVLNLGPWAGNTVLTIETGPGTVMTTLFAGCDYEMDVAAVQGRLIATYITPTRVPCRLYPPYGMTLRGWLFGLPAPTPLPPPASVPAALAVPIDRGASAALFPAGLPAALQSVRTQDVRKVGDIFQFQTVVRNDELLELLVLPDASSGNAWIVRDAATVKMTGRIIDLWDETGTPAGRLSGFQGALCFDPRSADCAGIGAAGRFTLDLGTPSANAIVPIDVTLGTVPFSICNETVVEVEIAILQGRFFATRFLRATGGSCPFSEPI
ncbi:MAG TPA: hypothetical protein VFT47_14265 [Vicinamibacterales bacterium]|nr:hypothetical protein [Vicinamibacterales bacterium]